MHIDWLGIVIGILIGIFLSLPLSLVLKNIIVIKRHPFRMLNLKMHLDLKENGDAILQYHDKLKTNINGVSSWKVPISTAYGSIEKITVLLDEQPIQIEKTNDNQFRIIFPKPFYRGQIFNIKTTLVLKGVFLHQDEWWSTRTEHTTDMAEFVIKFPKERLPKSVYSVFYCGPVSHGLIKGALNEGNYELTYKQMSPGDLIDIRWHW